MNPTIKNRYTGVVIFEGEAGMTTRQMLEQETTSERLARRCAKYISTNGHMAARTQQPSATGAHREVANRA